MSLRRLKWIAIAAPVGFLAVAGYLIRGPVHEELHHFPGYLLVLAALTVAVAIFSFFVFGVIGRVERSIIEQNEHLSALLAVGQAASSSLHVADVLDAALDAILSVTSAESAEVWLVDDGGDLVLARRQGVSVDALRERTKLRLGEGLPGLAAQTNSPVVVHDLRSDPSLAGREAAGIGLESVCAQPFARRGEPVGVLAVASRSSAALSSTAERRLLVGIGEQLAIAVENAQLHERVLDAAVLEERERLARELHDGLAQVLGYVNTQALAIEKLLTSGRGDEARAQVTALREAALRVYTDVREAILGLRSTHDTLLPSLRSYVADYERMSGTRVLLAVEPEAEEVRLLPAVDIQLMRIVHEALANVRKHAFASSATVRVQVDDGAVVIEVVDDGRGFDLDQPVRTGWPHFGLQTMRERAQAIGGLLEIDSTPGSGTSILVRVPLEAPVETRHASLAG